MRNSSQTPGTNAQGSASPNSAAPSAGDPGQAAVGPIPEHPEPASVAANPVPGRRADTPAEAQGRRILSTAFVMVGPGGHLGVELHDGRVLVLRDVVMRPNDYCGTQIKGDQAGRQYCGGYAEVAAARPGGGTAPE